MMRPRWSPEINFGHLLQAGVVILMVAPGFIGMARDQARLDTQQKDMAIAAIAAADAEAQRISTVEQRVATDEATEAANWQEMRHDLADLLTAIGKLEGAIDNTARHR